MAGGLEDEGVIVNPVVPPAVPTGRLADTRQRDGQPRERRARGGAREVRAGRQQAGVDLTGTGPVPVSAGSLPRRVEPGLGWRALPWPHPSVELGIPQVVCRHDAPVPALHLRCGRHGGCRVRSGPAARARGAGLRAALPLVRARPGADRLLPDRHRRCLVTLPPAHQGSGVQDAGVLGQPGRADRSCSHPRVPQSPHPVARAPGGRSGF